jgi:hypothetical protein
MPANKTAPKIKICFEKFIYFQDYALRKF